MASPLPWDRWIGLSNPWPRRSGKRQAARDLAMLSLPARLGLRAGEVAGLALDEIDWCNGGLR